MQADIIAVFKDLPYTLNTTLIIAEDLKQQLEDFSDVANLVSLDWHLEVLDIVSDTNNDFEIVELIEQTLEEI